MKLREILTRPETIIDKNSLLDNFVVAHGSCQCNFKYEPYRRLVTAMPPHLRRSLSSLSEYPRHDGITAQDIIQLVKDADV